MQTEQRRHFHVSYGYKRHNSDAGFGSAHLSFIGGVLNYEAITGMREKIENMNNLPRNSVVIIAVLELEDDNEE